MCFGYSLQGQYQLFRFLHCLVRGQASVFDIQVSGNLVPALLPLGCFRLFITNDGGNALVLFGFNAHIDIQLLFGHTRPQAMSA